MAMSADTAISSTDGFIHIRIIIGMVLGLSMARLVNGMTRFVQHPGSLKIYPIHLGWVLFVLLAIIHFWWYEFYLRMVQQWTFPLYFFLVVYAMLYAALAALLFPDQINDYKNYEDYFEARKRWFYGLFALTFLVDIGDSWIKGGEYWASLGAGYAIREVLFIGCALAAMFVPGKRFQAFFLVGGFIYQVIWILLVYQLL